MIVVLGVHRSHQAQTIGNRSEVRDQFGQLHAALSMAIKTKRRAEKNILVAQLKGLDLLWMRLSAAFREFGFVIEEVHLRWTAVLTELNDGSSSRREMGWSRRQRMVVGNGGCCSRAEA